MRLLAAGGSADPRRARRGDHFDRDAFRRLALAEPLRLVQQHRQSSCAAGVTFSAYSLASMPLRKQHAEALDAHRQQFFGSASAAFSPASSRS